MSKNKPKQTTEKTKKQKISFPRPGITRNQILEEAEAYSEAIQENLEKAKQGSSLPAIDLGYSDGVRITIKRSFIQNYMPVMFSTKLGSVEDVMSMLEQFYRNKGISDSEIAKIMNTAPQDWEIVMKKMQTRFVDECVSVFAKRREELMNYTFSILFSVIHGLAMAEVGEELAEQYGDGQRLAQQTGLPQEIADELAAMNRQLTKTSWRDKSVKIQEIYTTRLFGVQRGGDNNRKIKDRENPSSRADFLIFCLALREFVPPVFQLAKSLPSQKRISIIREAFSIEKYPLLIDPLLEEIAELVDTQTITEQVIDEFVLTKAAKIIFEGDITHSYAKKLYYEIRKDFLEGKLAEALSEDQTEGIKWMLSENKYQETDTND